VSCIHNSHICMPFMLFLHFSVVCYGCYLLVIGMAQPHDSRSWLEVSKMDDLLKTASLYVK
jgi:hypothetical protein